MGVFIIPAPRGKFKGNLFYELEGWEEEGG
jgi:hypothetical protein